MGSEQIYRLVLEMGFGNNDNTGKTVFPQRGHTSQTENLCSTVSAAQLNPMVTNLGNIAVNKAVFIIHNEMFEILRRKHLPLPHVAQTRLLQQLPALLEGPLSCQQLQLLEEV